MKVFSRLHNWWTAGRVGDGSTFDRGSTVEGGSAVEGDSPFDGDTPSWLASLMVHLAILIGVAVVGGAVEHRAELMSLVTTTAPTEDEPLAISEEFSYSATPQEQIGSSGSEVGDAGLSAAPTLAITASLPSQLEASDAPVGIEPIRIQDEIRVATGLNFAENVSIKGAAGVGATSATGAIDELTQEIYHSLEIRRTLVVWLFDQSGSLERQRAEIDKHFDRIYEELGVIEASGNPAFKKHEDKPLLSAVVAFGEKISFLTPKPTDDVQELKSAITSMKTDTTGVERTFEAVIEAVDRYRTFRTQGRNVMLVIFTDEVGDDEREVDRAIGVCRKFEIPVYCVGVPAPFGRRDALVKYVDPDPKFDQAPQWVPVRQGPESYQCELVQIGQPTDDPIDSGFGPYSLTRLCYETNGIFWAMHPNRNDRKVISRRETATLSSQLSRFFDPEVMRVYRPDYVPIKDYNKLLNENKARLALVQAAQAATLVPMEHPQLEFPKRDEADLAGRMQKAQHDAAILEPKLERLTDLLRSGEKDRPRLTKPRWQAGYDLSLGRVLAMKVRTQGYNAMLANPSGLRFKDAKNDTWRLVPSNEILTGSKTEKEAAQAKTYLERVVKEHPGTPWALLAEKELKDPLGWSWKEAYTGVNAPPKVAAAANNNLPRRTPQDEKARMLNKPVKRPRRSCSVARRFCEAPRRR